MFEQLHSISSAAMSNVDVEKEKLSSDIWEPPVDLSHLSETERNMLQLMLGDE